MKDSFICGQSITKDTIFKDAVIIGNGPSGISLSYMLSGHWPYWIPELLSKHPDELLRARLNYADCTKSLVFQNLMALADGLEGRSTNPVSLLLDSLQNPCADLGMELPSMLEYRFHADKQIDHVVLGKGRAGGSWHRMDPNLRTLSLSSWMSLPGWSYNDWEATIKARNLSSRNRELLLDNSETNFCDVLQQTNRNRCGQNLIDISSNQSSNLHSKQTLVPSKSIRNDQKSIDIFEGNNDILTRNIVREDCGNNITELPRRNLSIKRQISKEVQTRALVSRVAQYYEDYVTKMDLNKHFINNTVVTEIWPLNAKDIRTKGCRWLINGLNKNTGRPFSYACKNVVLANGASDLVNKLGLRGENYGMSWIKHELPQLEIMLAKLTDSERLAMKPVLIVGAGLSAADAVTICRSSGISVIHVFRNRSIGLDKMLPENVYPEYHEVHKMMKDTKNVYDKYMPLPEHTIIDLAVSSTSPGSHRVTVQNIKTDEIQHIYVSFCAVLIGSRPDLRFLPNFGQKIDEMINKPPYLARMTIDGSDTDETNVFNKRILWLRNLYTKCKHLNFCDRSVGGKDARKICGHTVAKLCECRNIKLTDEMHLLGKTTPIQGYEKIVTFAEIGEDPEKPVDCKTNPIAVNKFTNEVQQLPKGLFAMGPLVGDNFVRFIPGGALAITASLYKEND